MMKNEVRIAVGESGGSRPSAAKCKKGSARKKRKKKTRQPAKSLNAAVQIATGSQSLLLQDAADRPCDSD